MKKLIVLQYQRVKKFYLKHERLLMPATLVVGFLFDYFTFASIDIKITFTVLSIYWFLAGITIVFVNVYDTGRVPLQLKYPRLFAPLFLQFLFGALLSASLIFYWFSGALSISWPIILIVALLMVFNDVFRHYFLKPTVQISVYFFATISILSVILPFLINSLSPWLFVAAGVLSFVIVFLLIYFLSFFSKEAHRQKAKLFACVFAILFLMNVFYFVNVIPPLPLALREAGLYHEIKPFNSGYKMKGEVEDFWQPLFYGQTVHAAPLSRVYLYTSVFAPAKLKTTVVHHWQYYDESKKEWIIQGKLSFDIAGGRKEGYKGYSFKSNLEEGSWRVFVENQRGQVLGRVRFNVKKTEGPVNLVETIR